LATGDEFKTTTGKPFRKLMGAKVGARGFDGGKIITGGGIEEKGGGKREGDLLS